VGGKNSSMALHHRLSDDGVLDGRGAEEGQPRHVDLGDAQEREGLLGELLPVLAGVEVYPLVLTELGGKPVALTG